MSKKEKRGENKVVMADGLITCRTIDYSCSYKGRQGWIYISENYLGFHSFLLGAETKTLIELKDIEDIKKERSKGIFDDSLRLTTKNKKEVYCAAK